MPDETRRRIGETLAAHAPLRLPDEALDARAAVTLVLRPPAAPMAATDAVPASTARDATEQPGGEADVARTLTAELLFVRRAVLERDPWSGHMALPGGRRDPTDADLMETALRELREETALKLDPSEVIGRLSDVAPGNPALPAIGITPFVAWHETGAGVRSTSEATDHVWVPLPVMLDDAYRSVLRLRHRGRMREFPTVEYRGYTIWGLTYRIVMNFLGLLRGEPTSPGFGLEGRTPRSTGTSRETERGSEVNQANHQKE